MTLWHGNVFRISGPLCEGTPAITEWFPSKKASNAELWCFLCCQPGPVFFPLLRVSSDYAHPITGQITEVTCRVIGWTQRELTLSKRYKTGPEQTVEQTDRGRVNWDALPIEIPVKLILCVVFDNKEQILHQFGISYAVKYYSLSSTCWTASCGTRGVFPPYICHWPALRAGLLCCNFFGQPGSVSKFPPFVWVKLWVGWVGRGYTEISRYFPASWINWVTLVTKIKLLYSLRF